ncbi:Lipopolysaccharide kinase (Kdo/WaaP) family protein [Flavobacterium fluvii]|uniref:Lipopolysaccharide kinase (Kdo/WaaP) family protein n=1 Tax=Flavobacterium fluvii TaxID=468056 RepID=A0A1M5LHS2_9FLAO|nr:lipopolysaccharide kinase InaA family protein [Flavobacterium fluvii]SHG64548.1 Lipopolysaccharide kinase (Kdo/WaaP) family protein [Flavobacterium fluvii]
MKFTINPFFEIADKEIVSVIKNFNSTGILFGDGKRNKIKLFELEGKTINVKSFKIPHLVNKIAYKYFRKSKARRSFEYATTLLEKGIGTPQPIAYFENQDFIGLKDSYYVSEHLQCDLTYRELVEIPDFPDHENILRQFTQFSFDLHEKGIEFLDHSPGNTLIKKNAQGNYDFFLVDLNRMNFHDNMDFDSRMKNLSHLTPKKEMIALMSNEYSKLYPAQTEAAIFEKMWFYTNDFQERFAKKRRLKKKLKFWKA